VIVIQLTHPSIPNIGLKLILFIQSALILSSAYQYIHTILACHPPRNHEGGIGQSEAARGKNGGRFMQATCADAGEGAAADIVYKFAIFGRILAVAIDRDF
jgi:hypothetical protein